MTPIGFFCLALAAFGIASARSPQKSQWSGRTDQRIGSEKSHRALRIVGGKEAKPHSVPWQVGLFTEVPRRTYWCGGSIISKRYVLTATHCTLNETESMRKMSPREILVMAGAHKNPHFDEKDVEEPTRSIHAVKKIVRYPYKKSEFTWLLGEPDIALLKLKKSFKFSKDICPVALASKGLEKDFDEETKFVATGWGKLKWGEQEDNADTLQKVSIQWKSECEHKTKWIICAGDADSNHCGGDSGGPLTWKDPKTKKVKLVGVTSYSNGFCKAPGGYSKVSKVLKWIKKICKKE